MPQFDQVTFSNQIFWFFFVLLSFYFYTSYFFLPSLCENLKARKKKLIMNDYFFKFINREQNFQTSLKLDIIQQNLLNFETSVQLINDKVLGILKPTKNDLFGDFGANNFFRSYSIKNFSYPKRFN